jgi:hypothetical protein
MCWQKFLLNLTEWRYDIAFRTLTQNHSPLQLHLLSADIATLRYCQQTGSLIEMRIANCQQAHRLRADGWVPPRSMSIDEAVCIFSSYDRVWGQAAFAAFDILREVIQYVTPQSPIHF